MIGPKLPSVEAKCPTVEQEEHKETEGVWVIDTGEQPEGGDIFPTAARNKSWVPFERMFCAVLDVLQKPKSITQCGKIPVRPQNYEIHENAGD
jgi:hypothetical protein